MPWNTTKPNHVTLETGQGASVSKMASKLSQETFTYEFKSHWEPHSYGHI